MGQQQKGNVLPHQSSTAETVRLNSAAPAQAGYAARVIARLRVLAESSGRGHELLDLTKPGSVPVGAAIQMVRDCGGDCDAIFSAETIES